MTGLAKLYIALTGKKTAPSGVDAEGLLEALEAARRVVRLDWKEDPSEAASALAAMAQRAGVAKKTAHALLDVDEEEMEKYLSRAAGILRDAGASIVEIDVGGDEYNLAVLPEAVARAAVAARGAKGVKVKVVRAAPKPKAKGRSEAAKTDGDSPEAMRRAVVVLEKARAKREKWRARHPDLAPSFSDANVSVCIGTALAAAGAPAEQWRVPWAHAGALVAQHLTDVAERFGYVHLGVEFFDAVCAAWLARAEGPIFELLGRHPLLKHQSPHPNLIGRAHLVFTSGVRMTAAEKKALSKWAHMAAYGALLDGADAPDERFARLLAEWLRLDWAKENRAMARNRDPEWPYPGPISTVACALVARRKKTPRLPEDVARFVSDAVVDAARRTR